MSVTQKNIEQVVDLILEDYAGGRDIDLLETAGQPDKDVIIDVIEKLRRIVFPGYFHDKTYRSYNAKHNLSMLIEDVMFNLSRQVALVLPEAADAVEFLAAHPGNLTLQRTRAALLYGRQPEVPRLLTTEGGLRLAG